MMAGNRGCFLLSKFPLWVGCFQISTALGSRPWRRSLFVLSYFSIKMKAGAFSGRRWSKVDLLN
jgi:hypothetical protein